MCKCSPNSDRLSNNFRNPYCEKKECKPSKEWAKIQKKCPWLWKRVLYGPKKNDLCSALSSHYSSGWSSGDFSKYFCSEENCAPHHFFKMSSKDDVEVKAKTMEEN